MDDERVALPSAAGVVKGQLRYAWMDSRGVLQDVDEDEYFWEPAPLCWSVRRRSPDVRGWGTGEFVCEDAFPAPDPLPVTTIAWRVVHLAAWTDITSPRSACCGTSIAATRGAGRASATHSCRASRLVRPVGA
jgi:hypothetical protein